MISQNYNLNLIPGNVPIVVHCSQYDKTSRTLNFRLYKGDELFTIPSGCSVEVQGIKPDNTGFQYSCSYSGSTVTIDIQEQMTVLNGIIPCEVRITKDGEILSTANFVLDVERAPLNQDTPISESDYPLLEEAITYGKDAYVYAEKAEASATQAENAKNTILNEKYVKTVNSTAPDSNGNVKINALPTGGSVGQVLTKNSATNGDASWKNTMALASASNGEILVSDNNGQAYGGGQTLSQVNNSISSAIDTAKTYTDTSSQAVKVELGRRTRKNITSNLTNLTTAIAEQNLEKYGYQIGDYFVGASGYVYHLADMDTNYGGYSNQAVVSTHHCGIVVDTKSTSQWDSSGTVTNYSSSTLHTFLTDTALPNIKSDITALFGDWTGHLVARTELDNAINGWGTAWTGLANCYICAMTEVQVYGSRVFGIDGYQTGTGNKQLDLFRRFRFNEIFGNMWVWLKSIYSASYACDAYGDGYANRTSVAYSSRASGLILFH